MSRSKARGAKPRKSYGARSAKKTVTKTTTVTKPTMSMTRRVSSNPFPRVKNVTLLYKNTSNSVSSTTGVILNRVRCNSLADFDYDNLIGNKGPLYKDQLLSSTGPYTYYKVNSWKTTIKVINCTTALQGQTDCPLFVHFDQGTIGSFSEADTDAEIQNRPGVISKILTIPAGAKPTCYIKSYQKLSNFAPVTSKGLEYGAAWNSNPTNTIFSTLYIRRVDNSTTTFACAFQVTHKFYVTLYSHDAVPSV